jgi:hypothetical protein
MVVAMAEPLVRPEAVVGRAVQLVVVLEAEGEGDTHG